MKNYLKKIYNFLDNEEKRRLKIILSCGIINLFLELITLSLILPILYHILGQNTYSQFDKLFINNIFILLGVFITSIVIKNIFFYFSNQYLLKFLKQLNQKVSVDLLQYYLSIDYLEYLKVGYSGFSRSIVVEVNYLVNFYRGLIEAILHSLIFIGIFIFLLFYNFQTTFMLILFYLVFLYLPSLLIHKKIDNLAIERKNLDKKKLYISNHIFQNLNLIKLMKVEEFFKRKFQLFNKGQQNNFYRLSRIQVLPKILVELSTLIFLMIFIIFSITMDTSLENLITLVAIFIFAAIRIMPSINQIMSSLQSIRYFNNTFLSISEKKDYKLRILSKLQDINHQHSKDDTEIKNNIVISSVSFKYPGNENHTLKDINLVIKKNSIFGIQGDSGSGKTTLVNLILGLLKPDKGSIKYEGKDIFNNIDSWQKEISYVPSNYSLLNEILKYNVAYGIEEKLINDDNVKNLISKLELNSLTNQQKFTINSLVDEDGKNFSAGQIQRICIARALYKKSSILILDEPTSNLDKKNAYKIIDWVKKISNQTIIIISHDPGVLEKCDDKYVFE
jgi:ATP-binding cassette, subfamily B, bacterial PglK